MLLSQFCHLSPKRLSGVQQESHFFSAWTLFSPLLLPFPKSSKTTIASPSPHACQIWPVFFACQKHAVEKNWGQYNSGNLVSLTKQAELEKTYCLSSTTPNASYPGLVEFLGSLLMPRLKTETFLAGTASSPQPQVPPDRLPRTGFLFIAPLGRQALLSCSDSARMAQAPAGPQWMLRKILSGDSYETPGFLFPCFEAHRS